MVSESKIKRDLNALVDNLVQKSPFLRLWSGGGMEAAMGEKFLLTFNSLVRSFPSLIAAGAARARDEKTRTVLAVNLYQECGEGDVSRTHHAVYRKYLSSVGLDASREPEEAFALQWRADLLDYITGTAKAPAALGALAAGEFLAQPVLSRIYPILQSLYPNADQEYFTKHLDLETEHVQEITELLADQVSDEKEWNEVVDGFKFGLSVWESYFANLAEFLTQDKAFGTMTNAD